MSAAPGPDGGADDGAGPEPAVRSEWIMRFLAEVVRGRHVILHGNVHDFTLWDGRFVEVRYALIELLTKLKYTLIGGYDLVDGLTFAEHDGQQLLHGLLHPDAVDAEPDAGPAIDDGPSTAPATPAGQMLQRTIQAARAAAQQPVTYDDPELALRAIRQALAQDRCRAVFVVDFAEVLLTQPDRAGPDAGKLSILVKKAMIEARHVPGAPARNQLVILVPDLASIPAWLYRNEPFVAPLEVPLPTFAERHLFLRRQVSDFHQAPAPTDPDRTASAIKVMANVTEGMTIADLAALARTSKLEQVPLERPRELVNRAVFGRRTDPWTRLAEHGAEATRRLGTRVIGQSAAVEHVSRALTVATTGIGFVADPFSLEARPKGVFFFTGPTGVGKTELAKALADLVFDDESALIRFDMSTFAQEHAAERLTGAPPGYVGHERGGELTNRVTSRPFSVLLFDEIDKADGAVLDKFLQILEDGRLTDGLGQTTYFSQTLIIFTSNIGASVIKDWAGQEQFPDYATVSRHFNEAVQSFFIEEKHRPELLGRIGNGIIAFDLLRPEHINAIARKFLHQLEESASRARIELDLDDESILAAVRVEMADATSMMLGGRMIRTTLERLVLEPLAEVVRGGGGRFRVRANLDGGRVTTNVEHVR